MPFSVSGHSCSFTYLSAIHFLPIRRTAQMDELNSTVREQEIYEEMELTPEMVKSIRTLCATCLRHFVEAKGCTETRNRTDDQHQRGGSGR